MINSKYPKIQEHKDLHRKLIDELTSQQYKLLHLEKQADIDSTIEFLSSWLINHTAGADRSHFLSQFQECQGIPVQYLWYS